MRGPSASDVSDEAYLVRAIGHVVGGRSDPIDDDWGGVCAEIALDPALFTAEALLGLVAFSHAEVVFLFDRIAPDSVEYRARRPRGRADWPLTGIFAQRGSGRPNRLGVTICRITGVDGTRVGVEGLDAVDGTPVLDLKPVMREFLPREEVRQPGWVSELMANYW